MKRIWVTGAGGLIGSHIVQAAPSSIEALGITRSMCDLGDFGKVRELYEKTKPAGIIHCAAMSRSPECEKNPAEAHKQNVEVTRHLVKVAPEVPVLFFSSDLVFDGMDGNYTEESSVNPRGVYAETKVAAETVMREHPFHVIVRTSLNGGTSPTGDRGFDEQMRLAWRDGQVLRFFIDEFRCPIPAEATARAAWELLLGGAVGVFHVAGAERISRWELGKLVAKSCPELNPRYEPASLKEYKGSPRSPDTSLDCRKAQGRLSFRLPRISDWVKMDG